MDLFDEMLERAVDKQFMDLRDKLAMSALQGLLAGGYQGEYINAARHAYSYADSMLEAREA